MKEAKLPAFVLIVFIALAILATSCKSTKNYNKKPKSKHKLTVAYQPCFK